MYSTVTSSGETITRLAEPLVLVFAEDPVPVIPASLGGRGGAPVGINDHKQRIPPGKGVIISEQANRLHKLGVSGVKIIGSGLGVVSISGILRLDRHVFGCAIQISL